MNRFYIKILFFFIQRTVGHLFKLKVNKLFLVFIFNKIHLTIILLLAFRSLFTLCDYRNLLKR